MMHRNSELNSNTCSLVMSHTFADSMAFDILVFKWECQFKKWETQVVPIEYTNWLIDSVLLFLNSSAISFINWWSTGFPAVVQKLIQSTSAFSSWFARSRSFSFHSQLDFLPFFLRCNVLLRTPSSITAWSTDMYVPSSSPVNASCIWYSASSALFLLWCIIVVVGSGGVLINYVMIILIYVRAIMYQGPLCTDQP